MKSLCIFSLFLFAFGQVCLSGADSEKYGDTSWMINLVSKTEILLRNNGSLHGSVLYLKHQKEGWRLVIRTNHFLVNTKYGSDVWLSFKAKKPFTITGRSWEISSHLVKHDDRLLFYGSGEAVVDWMVAKELIEVSIKEMGGTQKVLIFDTHGLKEVMLEAQRRQRALK
jgi:hypothetical protein